MSCSGALPTLMALEQWIGASIARRRELQDSVRSGARGRARRRCRLRAPAPHRADGTSSAAKRTWHRRRSRPNNPRRAKCRRAARRTASVSAAVSWSWSRRERCGGSRCSRTTRPRAALRRVAGTAWGSAVGRFAALGQCTPVGSRSDRGIAPRRSTPGLRPLQDGDVDRVAVTWSAAAPMFGVPRGTHAATVRVITVFINSHTRRACSAEIAG